MSRLMLFGATGSLGRHVLHQALASGHEVSAVVRTPWRLSSEHQNRVAVHQGDLSTLAPDEISQLIRGHDTLINCAGRVTEAPAFVDLVDRLVTAVELLPSSAQPLCWFLAGAAILDIGSSDRKGVDLTNVYATYWPHLVNFERIRGSGLDWRLLCPGPMVEEPPLGLDRLRISLDTLPVEIPDVAPELDGPSLLKIFASLLPEMIVPYADAAALMVANLNSADSFSRHRVGLALPLGMRGKKAGGVLEGGAALPT